MFEKKNIPPLVAFILTYFVLRLPASLLEDWFVGEVLKQVENNGMSFLLLWVLPLLATIGVFALGGWIRSGFGNMRKTLAAEYQPDGGSDTSVGLRVNATVIVGRSEGLKQELNTDNRSDRLLEANVPIQSVRFTEPRDIIIRHDASLPVLVECEKSRWKRMRNRVFSVPAPRILVKRFTEKGIIWDEENTSGAGIRIEFYPK